MNYEIFISELRCYQHYSDELKTIKARIEEIDYELEGVKGIRYDKAPSAFNPSLSAEKKLDLIEKKAKLENRYRNIQQKMQMVMEEYETLPNSTKLMCLEILNGKTLSQIADMCGYTESGIQKKLKREIEKA